MTLHSARELVVMNPKLKLINSDTLTTTDMNLVREIIKDLVRWGYKKDHSERGYTSYVQGTSGVGISIDDAETKATIVVS
ncbi:hypothetical protein VPHD479_0255 [Vibrio phage D479]